MLVWSAIDCLERLVFEMTYYLSSGTLKPTHSLIGLYMVEGCAHSCHQCRLATGGFGELSIQLVDHPMKPRILRLASLLN